jgi:RNA polymerase sigma-70 factor (ECF subfamily)
MAPDEQDFTAFYRRHYDDVERYVRRRMTGEAVRDAVAEVFLVAWRRFSEIPREAELPWLYTVARHTLTNATRGTRRAFSLRERLQQQPAIHAPDPGARVADRLALVEVFNALPESHREILRLVAWEGLTVAAAAAIAGCSVPAATMRLHRARQQADEAFRRLTDAPGSHPGRAVVVPAEKEDRS